MWSDDIYFLWHVCGCHLLVGFSLWLEVVGGDDLRVGATCTMELYLQWRIDSLNHWKAVSLLAGNPTLTLGNWGDITGLMWCIWLIVFPLLSDLMQSKWVAFLPRSCLWTTTEQQWVNQRWPERKVDAATETEERSCLTSASRRNYWNVTTVCCFANSYFVSLLLTYQRVTDWAKTVV